MAKLIVFCADGTWNGPNQDDNGDKLPDPTNVFKLFWGLAGELSPDSINVANEQEKELLVEGKQVQIAKYIHGVGDSRNPIHKLFGGAFGAGIIARIVRGYTFISRNYAPGDRIVVVGFSRGAYTARALAGLIIGKGLLAKYITDDQQGAYRCGAQAWYSFRNTSDKREGFLQKLVEATADLPAYISRKTLKKSDYVSVDSLAAVAVWDTVGSLGLPNYIQNPGVDAFKFTNTRLSPKVEKGFHALALDEQRVDFIPTLWDVAANVEQVLFAGAHADVGGGYTTKNNESGLSDIALQWMVDKLKGIGVQFNTPVYPDLAPDPLGTAHKPWLSFPFNDPARIALRKFRAKAAVVANASIAERMGKKVKPDVGAQPEVYAPGNWR